jgi:hypothetical protein
MKCILKTGQVINDSIRVPKEELLHVNRLKVELEKAMAREPGDPKYSMTSFTFAHTTIKADEIAAIKIW